jgi:hypothetical protein
MNRLFPLYDLKDVYKRQRKFLTSYFLSNTSKTCLASSTLSLGKSAIAIAFTWFVVLNASERC